MDDYVTVAEAARRLNRSIEQVRRYLREGTLAGRRIGQQWFIEEAALAALRPGRGGDLGRVSEAIAVYEAPTMKTEEEKGTKRLISDELFAEIERLREQVRKEAGEFDVVALIRQSREEH